MYRAIPDVGPDPGVDGVHLAHYHRAVEHQLVQDVQGCNRHLLAGSACNTSQQARTQRVGCCTRNARRAVLLRCSDHCLQSKLPGPSSTRRLHMGFPSELAVAPGFLRQAPVPPRHLVPASQAARTPTCIRTSVRVDCAVTAHSEAHAACMQHCIEGCYRTDAKRHQPGYELRRCQQGS